jgi:hypothetical protein
MDFITNLPPFSSYDSILVVVDCLMKMVHFILCIEIITREIITKLLLDHVFRYYGLLEYIIFDYGASIYIQVLEVIF